MNLRGASFVLASAAALWGLWGCGSFLMTPIPYTPNPGAFPDAEGARAALEAVSATGEASRLVNESKPLSASGPVELAVAGGALRVHLSFPGHLSVPTPCEMAFSVPIAPGSWTTTANETRTVFRVTVPVGTYEVINNCGSPLTAEHTTLAFIFNAEVDMQRFLDAATALASLGPTTGAPLAPNSALSP